jgi:predicted ATP-dependent endonuclease of OLD family
MNEDVNIFVGDNDSGKTTILEALTMVLTGKVNSRSVFNMLNLDWFNAEVRNEFKQAIEEGDTPSLPTIEIEVYFGSLADNELAIKRFKGSNNSLHEDTEGVKLEIIFDDQYGEAYRQQLTDKKIRDIPIEYYKFVFRSFANPEHYPTITSKKVAYIDTTRKDYGSVLSRFVASSINEYLSEDDMTNLRHAYRANRHDFTENQAVKTLNEKLQASHSFGSKRISLNLKENEIDQWKNDMSISLNDIPLENSGFGTQNIFKSEIFLIQNNNVDILIIEEPENNLSYSNMSVLISKLSGSAGKQLFISTHSSFVANKLGLQHLHLVADKKTVSLNALSKETYDYFLKLPGYNTLRVLLSNQAVLVEGPADELIVQRAYIDHYGKQPIEDGIDVITVGGLAFQRYCELATLISKHITIVTDNDYDADTVKKGYEKYGNLVTLCVETNNNLNTLEPSLFAVNTNTFEEFRDIVYHGTDIKRRSAESIVQFMIKNKTEWSMRVFMSDRKINYPRYILEAIGKADADTSESPD